jgi:hypothetical protein
MSDRRDIEQFVAGTEIDTNPTRDRQVLREIMEAHGHFKESRPRESRPHLGKIMVNAGRRKWALAALVPLAVALSIIVSEVFREPAWAIEQTIAALEGFRAIYATGIASLDGKTAVQAESWARPSRDGTSSGDLRLQTESGYCVVVNEARSTTHTYDPARHVVEIQGGVRLYCQPWVNGDYFRHMKEACEQWHEEYAQDAASGQRYVIVKARNLHDGQSYEFHFDLRTKLPIRFKVWQNPDFAGSPYFNIEKIVYNPTLPEGLFDFQIPAGATVVDERSP